MATDSSSFGSSSLDCRPRILSLAASLLATTAILYWRKPDAFSNPQFWAEDGTVFFRDAYQEGAQSLFQLYSGYFHLIPRLVALIADAAPYAYAPAIYNYAALVGMWAVVAKLHSPRLHLPMPWAYALVLVLVPHYTGEVFVNLTNMQWPLALLLLLTALQEETDRLSSRIVDGLVVVLVGLSTPAIVLVAPIFLVRAALQRSRYQVTTALLAGAAAAMQVQAFLRHPTYPPASPGHTHASWTELLGWKTFGNLFLGRKLPYELPPAALALAGLALLAWTAWRLAHYGLGRSFALPALGFALAVTALSFYKFRAAADLLVPPAAAARYFYLFWVILGWCLVLLLQKGRPWARVGSSILLLLILNSSFATVFRSPPLRDFDWKSHADDLKAGKPLQIPINPPGWKIPLNQEETQKSA